MKPVSKRRTAFLGVLCVLWFGLISLLSSQEHEESTETSDVIAWIVLEIFEPGDHPESPFHAQNATSETVSESPETEQPAAEAVQSRKAEQPEADEEAVAASAHATETDERPRPKNKRTFGFLKKNSITTFVRKAAHFVLFFLFGILLSLFFRSLTPQARLLPALFALLTAFACASLDEFHQHFVAGRGAQFEDVLLDLKGAAASILLILVLGIIRDALKKRAARRR